MTTRVRIPDSTTSTHYFVVSVGNHWQLVAEMLHFNGKSNVMHTAH